MKIKRLFAGLLAATLVVAAVPAGVAEAKATPTNKAIAIDFSFSNPVETTLTASAESTKSETYDISMELYYPKSAIEEKATYSYDIALTVAYAEGDELSPAALGAAKASFSMSGGQFSFGSSDSYFSATEVGDYYCIAVKGLQAKLSQYVGGSISKFADVPEKVYVCPVITLKGSNTASGKIYLDNVSIMGGSSKAYTNNFQAAQEGSAYVGYGEDIKEANPVKFSAGKLDVKEKQTVKVGKTINLGAKADPAGKITYKSSNKKVATVDSKGVVKGIKKGKAKITVTANGLKQVVTVTVK